MNQNDNGIKSIVIDDKQQFEEAEKFPNQIQNVLKNGEEISEIDQIKIINLSSIRRPCPIKYSVGLEPIAAVQKFVPILEHKEKNSCSQNPASKPLRIACR